VLLYELGLRSEEEEYEGGEGMRKEEFVEGCWMEMHMEELELNVSLSSLKQEEEEVRYIDIYIYI
jgi:hypothetical protein